MEKIEVGNYVRARPSKRTKNIGGSIGLVRQLTEVESKKGKLPRALVLWPSGTDGLPHPFERIIDCELLVVCDLPRWMIPNDLIECSPVPVEPEPEPEPEVKSAWTTFPSAEGFHQGDRVRAGKGKKSEIGTIRWFVRVDDKWRALVGWSSDRTEQYVDLVKLHRVEPNFIEPEPTPPEPEPEPNDDEIFDHDKCPGASMAGCGGDLRFDPDIVGDTCGGLTLRGWDVCTKCGQQWLARKGSVPYDAAWKLASGGRSVETGDGRIRVDGCSNTGALMERILRLPELELEVARLRKDAKP